MSQTPIQPQGNVNNPAGGQIPMQNQMPQGQYPIQQPSKKPFYKKPWFIILAALVIIVIIGAAISGGDSNSSSKDGGNTGNTGTSEQAGDSQPADKAEVDTDYPTTIDGAEVTKDSYQGKDVIVVTYTWTNNSDKATSFTVALNAQAYQNGVELETSLFTDGAEVGDLRDVKPGTTSTVKIAYELADTSEVEVEVKEQFSLNDDIIASQKFAVQ